MPSNPSKVYRQANYVDAVKLLSPAVYYDTDVSIYGTEKEPTYEALSRLFGFARKTTEVFPVSGSTAASLRSHFSQPSSCLEIEPRSLESKLIGALGDSVANYKTRADFETFVSGTLQPYFHLNSPTDAFVSGFSANVSSVNTPLLAHNYLLENYSWLYILNTSGPVGGFAPSAIVTDLIVSGAYLGKTITTRDLIQGLCEYFWRNREVVSSYKDYINSDFALDASAVSAGTYTSGTQTLDALKTIIGVWYNPRDEKSAEFDRLFDLFFDSNIDINKLESAGPYFQFLKAVAYSFYDVDEVVSELEDLVSVEDCPEEFLPYLAALIGWKFISGDSENWRSQLRKAVYLYKSKGTRRSMRDAMSLIFPSHVFNVMDDMLELWETYLPRLLYYLLVTESAPLREGVYDENIKYQLGITPFDSTNHDNNYRFAVDRILEVLHDKYENIQIAPRKPFSVESWQTLTKDNSFSGFTYRGVNGNKVPPWEEEKFFKYSFISDGVLSSLSDILKKDRTAGGYEVSATTVASAISFIRDNSYDSSLLQGQNSNFKFYTSASHMPPNWRSVVASGSSKELGLLDFWNSKSSTVVSEVAVSAFKYAFEDLIYPQDEIMGAVADVLHQFTPFHVVVKLVNTEEFSDTHEASGVRFCLELPTPFNELTNDTIKNYQTCAFLGVSGTGNFSSLTFQKGRRVPAHDSGFWSATAGTMGRNTLRRRNLRGSLTPLRHTRSGRAMPLPPMFLSLSATPSALAGEMNTSEFIPKGFNFSSGEYFSPESSAHGWIYDTSNDISFGRTGVTDVSASYSGIDLSSTFPCRGIPVSSCFPVVFRNDVPGIHQSIFSRSMYLTGDVPSNIENFSFGNGIHRMYNSYVRDFSSVLRTETSSTYENGALVRHMFGGYSLASHVFGPIVWNGDFSFWGRLTSGKVDSHNAYPNEGRFELVRDYPHWKHIAAPASMKKDKYITFSGGPVLIGQGLMDPEVKDSFVSLLDLNSSTEQILIANASLASSVELVVPKDESGSLIVLNRFDSSTNADIFGGTGSVSIFNEGLETHRSASVRFVLGKNEELTNDPSFESQSSHMPARRYNPSTSSLAAWDLLDVNRYATWNKTGAGSGTISLVSSTVSSFVLAHVSGSGDWLDNDSAAIRTAADPENGITLQLIPSQQYTLTVDSSSSDATCSGFNIRIVNESRLKNNNSTAYLQANGTWGSTGASGPVVSAGVSNYATCSLSFSADASFSRGDLYSVSLLPNGPYSSGWTNAFNDINIRKISLLATSSLKTHNSLSPDSNYEMDVWARMRDNSPGLVGVRVSTFGIPNFRNLLGSNEGAPQRFHFDFDSLTWKPYGVEDSIFNIPFTSVEGGFASIRLPFHTRNNLTEQPVTTSWYTAYGPAHKEGRGYAIEFFNPLTTSTEPLTIDEVFILNKDYNKEVQPWGFDSLARVVHHFNSLTTGDYSRDAGTSNSTFETSGGSRMEYLDTYGGDTSGYPDTQATLSGTTYYVSSN